MVRDKIISAYNEYEWLYFITVAASGLILAGATFTTSPVIQAVSIFAMIPLFVAMLSGAMKKQRGYYLLGIVFLGAWLLPTTYWYYSFMNPFVAAAASIGFVLLLANMFYIFALRGKLPDYVIGLMFCVSWAVFTFIRLRLPIMEDWWIPHLGYAVWRNPAILQLGRIGGEAGIEFSILFFTVVCAVLIIRRRRFVTLLSSAVVIATVVIFNGALSRSSVEGLPIIITIQSSTPEHNIDATPYVIQKLQQQTRDALNNLGDTYGKDIYVVWPENRIPPENQDAIAGFARDNSINLIYHSYEQNVSTDAPYKIVVWLSSNGDIMLENSKEHIAPGEEGTARKSANVVNGLSAYICYDVHYPDIVYRMHGANLVFVVLNDEEFGHLQKTFHLADMALRAVQADVWIAASSKDGPTAIISPKGYVERSMPYKNDGFIVFP